MDTFLMLGLSIVTSLFFVRSSYVEFREVVSVLLWRNDDHIECMVKGVNKKESYTASLF